MVFEFKRLMTGSLLFLFILVTKNGLCSFEDGEGDSLQNNYIKTRNTLGKSCLKGRCSENEICNETFSCECPPGFINRSNLCEPCGGENDSCLKDSDCCGMLVCIKEVCRKATSNAEFITLAKICLGITITSIIIALLSSLLKCLMRYDSFQRLRRCEGAQPRNSMDEQGRHIFEPQPHPNIIHDEKPPSYEECIRTGQPFTEPPPPYVISSRDLQAPKQIGVYSVRNITEIILPANTTAPLNAAFLTQERNSEESITQKITST